MRILRAWWWLLVLVLLLGLYWLLPIEGSVLISSQPLDPNAQFPQYVFDPPAPRPGDEVLVNITDNVPWTYVELTVNNEPATFVQTQALPLQGQWSWTWRFTLPEQEAAGTEATTETVLAFYRDCDSGCRLRDQRALEPFATAGELLPAEAGTPTKLCVDFPDPQRDWHGRSGWGMDLTYAVTDTAYWQVDALAGRVQANMENGVRMLVRIDYAPQQSLPPTGDEEALARYLDHVRRLVRDERLGHVYGFIIGTGFNARDGNLLSPDAPTTPAWYARIFNGGTGEPGTPASYGPNVVQMVRANSPRGRLLVGPVHPWLFDSSGTEPYATDVPWLNYMNTLVALLDENTQRNAAAGIPLTGPDGFALNVPGRPSALDPEAVDPALEPTLSMPRDEWNGAQAGFRLYAEWLDIINSYPTTAGTPAFIVSTNTFTPDMALSDATTPAQTYPTGWLTNALQTINQEPQIQSLCWFMDWIPGDQRWHGFSLALGEGRVADAAAEFDALLQE